MLSLQKKLDEGTQSAAALRQEHREMAEQHEERERERADLVEAREGFPLVQRHRRSS